MEKKCKFCKKKIVTQMIEVKLKDVNYEQIHFIYLLVHIAKRKI